MVLLGISDKVNEKWNKENIDLHKRVITTYLAQNGLNTSKRNKFFVLYDKYISPDNILLYFNKPVHIFVKALVLNRLDKISDYIPKYSGTKKRTRRSVRKKTKD